MRRVGQARKRDASEAAIVAALEAIGVTVLRLSGEGVPDLLCHTRGIWLPVEIKQVRSRRLTPAQCLTYAIAPFPIVTTVAEALALYGVRG